VMGNWVLEGEDDEEMFLLESVVEIIGTRREQDEVVLNIDAEVCLDGRNFFNAFSFR